MPTPLQAGRIEVEVVAIAAGINFVKTVLVPTGQTLGWAVNASGVLALHPALRAAPLGIWGKVLSANAVLAAGDRAEVYQPINPAALVAQRNRLKARLHATQNTGKVQR